VLPPCLAGSQSRTRLHAAATICMRMGWLVRACRMPACRRGGCLSAVCHSKSHPGPLFVFFGGMSGNDTPLLQSLCTARGQISGDSPRNAGSLARSDCWSHLAMATAHLVRSQRCACAAAGSTLPCVGAMGYCRCARELPFFLVLCMSMFSFNVLRVGRAASPPSRPWLHSF
jgi:hypothetical protein